MDFNSIDFKIFARLLEEIKHAVIDESILAYEPCSSTKDNHEVLGDTIPVTYIPRKPHPNGLLLYGMVTTVKSSIPHQSDIPFCVGFVPYISGRDVCPTKMYKTFSDRYIFHQNFF